MDDEERRELEVSQKAIRPITPTGCLVAAFNFLLVLGIAGIWKPAIFALPAIIVLIMLVTALRDNWKNRAPTKEQRELAKRFEEELRRGEVVVTELTFDDYWTVDFDGYSSEDGAWLHIFRLEPDSTFIEPGLEFEPQSLGSIVELATTPAGTRLKSKTSGTPVRCSRKIDLEWPGSYDGLFDFLENCRGEVHGNLEEALSAIRRKLEAISSQG